MPPCGAGEGWRGEGVRGAGGRGRWLDGPGRGLGRGRYKNIF